MRVAVMYSLGKQTATCGAAPAERNYRLSFLDAAPNWLLATDETATAPLLHSKGGRPPARCRNVRDLQGRAGQTWWAYASERTANL